MYSQENYIWGLVAYGMGFLMILPALLWVTRVTVPWQIPRALVRLFFVALLLTPVKAYNDMHFLAPAWVVAAFEFMKPSSVEGPARALTPMVVVFAGLVVACCLWYFLRHYWQRKR